MGLFEGILNVANIAQKADNIELYKQLLDLGKQALEMQDEIRKLKEENAELKKGNDLESRIIRHSNYSEDGDREGYPYITLSGDAENIKYCAVCWGRDHKLIQLYNNDACMECQIKREQS